MERGSEKKSNEKEGGHQYKRAREEPRGRKFQQYTPLSTNKA